MAIPLAIGFVSGISAARADDAGRAVACPLVAPSALPPDLPRARMRAGIVCSLRRRDACLWDEAGYGCYAFAAAARSAVRESMNRFTVSTSFARVS